MPADAFPFLWKDVGASVGQGYRERVTLFERIEGL
jgi:hypothetical protein